MSLVVLDTDVASAILRGRLHDRLRARLAGNTLCITFVTLGELTKWTALRSWGPRKLADLAQWRSGVVLLPFDEAVATTWDNSRLGRSIAGGPVRRMTPGLRRAAWSTGCRWRRSTARTTPTSPSTTAFASSTSPSFQQRGRPPGLRKPRSPYAPASKLPPNGPAAPGNSPSPGPEREGKGTTPVGGKVT
ncbi:PIN domain-containing protein [Micromonospora carbonacea]|uniref:PIN domain-containing protein n=1 Tax=Micromonospora carbonacea TaxID=47853 RepID=UPI0031B623D7